MGSSNSFRSSIHPDTRILQSFAFILQSSSESFHVDSLITDQTCCDAILATRIADGNFGQRLYFLANLRRYSVHVGEPCVLKSVIG